MASVGSFSVPLARLDQVPWCAPPIAVKISKLELSFGFPLFGGFAQPEQSFGVALCHSLTLQEFQSQRQLRLCDALEGRLLIPLDRFAVRLKDPITRFAHAAQVVLGHGVSVFSLPPHVSIIGQPVFLFDPTHCAKQKPAGEPWFSQIRSLNSERTHNLIIGSLRELPRRITRYAAFDFPGPS